VDILHYLPKVDIALPGAVDYHTFRLFGGESNYLLLLISPTDCSTIEHDHLLLVIV
jgi:hypothetical protein